MSGCWRSISLSSVGQSTEVWVLSFSKKCISYLMYGCQLKVNIFWALNRGSGPFTLTKTWSLTWCLDANSRLFFLGTQPKFWPFFCCLIHLPFQDTYACKLSHRVLSSSLHVSCPFFQGALPLAALPVSWGCYKFFLPVAVLNYSICVIS